MAPDSNAAPAPAAPLSERTAFAVLGSMVLLIVALTVLLIQTTWIDSASASEPPAADGTSLAQR
ncbi:MAG TPA: hypothetical protein VFN08_20195 [Gemmatimonadales bacterium]|nr:hypothetical protein [Gemmatimonadales bacterium]